MLWSWISSIRTNWDLSWNHHEGDTIPPLRRDPVPYPSSPLAEKETHRILLGIFTTNSRDDESRRQLIRKTYLSNFRILAKVGLVAPDAEDTICSLADFVADGNKMKDCSIIYTFVMGAMDKSNTTAPTDLTELADQDKVKYVVERPSSLPDTAEKDILYLNIRENMNAGKTVTWFRYASSILPAAEFGIDLIGKVDLDAVLLPRPILEDLNNQISERPAQRIYGGYDIVQRNAQTDTPYMQGGTYFLSTDVAKQVTSDACNRRKIVKQHVSDMGYKRAEDREIGLFVDQCFGNGAGGSDPSSSPVPMVITSHVRHSRANKKLGGFRVRWKEGFASDIAAMRYQMVKEKYKATNGCPSTKALADEEEAWFDGFEKMVSAQQRYVKLVKDSCSSSTIVA
jgi:hypothetical protein